MANRASVEAVDVLCRQLGDANLPFGGKALIAVGDFRQVAPVVKGGSLADVIDASIKSSWLWPSFHVLHLTQPMRNAADLAFSAYVDDIGEDTAQERSIILEMVHTLPSIATAIDWLYPLEVLRHPHTCIRRSYLAPLNAYVDEINKTVLDRLPGAYSESIYNHC